MAVHLVLTTLFVSGGCSSHPMTFSQAPEIHSRVEGTTRILAVGDTGKGNEGQARVARSIHRTCEARGCDAIVLLGDNIYSRGMTSPDDPRAQTLIAEPYAQEEIPVFLVLGNHDYAHGRDRQRAAWQVDWAARTPGVHLPAHAWHTQLGPVQLVGLDTNAAMHFGAAPQVEWLDDILDETVPVRVVAGHHPLRSNGPHGNAGAYEGWRSVPVLSGGSVAQLLEPMCDRVNVYLSGHDHSRQLIRHCGVSLIVSGAGASVTRLVDRGNDPEFARATLGFTWLELTSHRGDVTFFDADGVVEGTFLLFEG